VDWFTEDLHCGVTQSIRIDEEIYSGSSDYQSVHIFRNDLLGQVLVLDGAVQVAELDEHIYSEMMVHVPLLSHPDPRNVLVIGGGDGTCLRETVKHSSVERVMLVELDGRLIALCKTHLSEMACNSFGHEKAAVHIGEGFEFVRDTDVTFDVIIVDSTDPEGPSEPLFTREFYLACKKALSDGGILIAQAGNLMYQDDFGSQIGNHFSSIFALHGYYQATVPSYIGGLHAFAWGSDKANLAGPAFREAAFPTRYYSDNTRQAAFLLPV
jgi:spermidine synthase